MRVRVPTICRDALFVISGICIAGSGSARGAGVPIATPRGNLEFKMTGFHPDGTAAYNPNATAVVDGSVANNTHVDITAGLRFELIFNDENGVQVPICTKAFGGPAPCELEVFGTIPSGGERKLTEPGNVLVGVSGIPKGRKITSYATRLIKAEYSPKYIFGADPKNVTEIEAQAKCDVKEGMSFVLTNKTDSAIEILWDQSSFIDRRQEASRIIHAGVSDKDRAQPNTVIPPFAKISDVVFPADYVEWTGRTWLKKPLLPADLDITKDDPSKLDGLVGQSLHVYLRMLIGDRKADYWISFPLLSVQY